jgi:hypothetical protein
LFISLLVFVGLSCEKGEAQTTYIYPLEFTTTMPVDGKEAVEAALVKIRPKVEQLAGRTFEQFDLHQGLGVIHAIVGLSYHWSVIISPQECIHLRIFEAPQQQVEELHIVAMKICPIAEPFQYLHPRFGLIQ